MRLTALLLSIFVVVLFLTGCQKKSELKIDFEKYTLANGLEVILHTDKSDPIASVAVVYHVGSNRELKGRTGFAHLFEHMLFQESQHVGQDQFFKKIQGSGGTLNGFTFEDGTGYYEVVPKNALEMAMWLESDRMGWLLSTVTDEALLNQKDVVQNEKRFRVDNRPYGHTNYIIHKLLYPENHPYNWQVIGELEDIGNATRDDVVDFYKKWYGPNNATLVIAGDLDIPQTKEWVEKYFGEIKRGEETTDPKPQHVSLDKTKRVSFEDNFASSAELNMVFPTVEQYTDDSYALDLLTDLLSDGKKAPFYKVIVEEKKLAPRAYAYVNPMEITGQVRFNVRAFPGKNLQEIEDAVFEALARFEAESFTEADLNRIKAKSETNFYNGISSILSKSFQLAFYNEYAGSPGYVTKDIERKLAVTKEDIMRVYNTYIKDKNYVLTSFVPKGKLELSAKDCELFPLKEEKIDIAGLNAAQEEKGEKAEVEKIPTEFDRSVEPKKGAAPALNLPDVWTHTFSNGLKMYGIVHDELPLVQYSLTVNGGMLLDKPEKIGVANLISDMMMEGTANKTPLELEETIDGLGANVNMFTGKQSIGLTANMLKSRTTDVAKIVEEIITQPRWDEKEFARIKTETIEAINRQKSDPGSVARNVWAKLLYKDHILSNNTYGSEGSVENISIDDLKNFYTENFSPSVSYITIVGSVSKDEAIKLFSPLEEKWQAKEVTFAEYALPEPVTKKQLYFVDIPGAKQSQIYVGKLALKYTDADYYPSYVMNYNLGGSFNSNVNMILREEKGYTYGARSGFSGTEYPGPFAASSAVRSNATGESVKIFKDEIDSYRNGITEDELAFTKNALIQSNARRFETFGGLLGMLKNIARYNLPHNYMRDREEIVTNMTLENHKDLANKYLQTENMIFLVVGDAATQKSSVEKLGLGKAISLDKDGNVLN
ncbi:MAG: insulinase family protein [Calditrichaeota bacterium]|nr:MAG: insulinase family protein [Calditrichota bacterium]MBL1204454.1 insulinase family protein [Calditrichota bacterium]NOG44283.1 insulinase family protein [Calditrichota bacterium]